MWTLVHLQGRWASTSQNSLQKKVTFVAEGNSQIGHTTCTAGFISVMENMYSQKNQCECRTELCLGWLFFKPSRFLGPCYQSIISAFINSKKALRGCPAHSAISSWTHKVQRIWNQKPKWVKINQSLPVWGILPNWKSLGRNLDDNVLVGGLYLTHTNCLSLKIKTVVT